MALSNDFKTFIDNIKPDKNDAMLISTGEIAKKLNKEYYDLTGDSESHIYIVGSVGRKTNIKGSSDLDLIFDLPIELWKKYDNYGDNSNGQSALIQDVKNVLSSKYTNTELKGDGQVVIIKFNSYTVELVPAFMQNDRSFKHPDSNNGGSWKITKPIPEIEESINIAHDTNFNFVYICNLLRSWKNNVGFKFGGLLIDTLAYNFLQENEQYKNINFDDYFNMLKDLFKYLKALNKDQSFWYALGSNQKVYNNDGGNFIKKANKAFNKISTYSGHEDDINSKLQEIFGTTFPNQAVSSSTYSSRSTSNEQFIERLFNVDVQYSLQIDCDVKQNGFREHKLRFMLFNRIPLLKNKKLNFYISSNDIPQYIYSCCDIYWKVRNIGAEAIRRQQIRGEIIKTNSESKTECSSFKGEHYVECYIIYDNTCIARSRIDVPIQ